MAKTKKTTSAALAAFIKKNCPYGRRQFLDRLEEMGWRPSDAALSRWLSGEREPGAAALVLLRGVGVDL